MPKKIILLTGKREAPHLVQFIKMRRPDLAVAAVTTKAEFQNVVFGDLRDIRLISFCTGIIVSEAVLSRFNLEPYNIHPGPKNYPGVCPEAFAVRDGAAKFGATAHVMTAEVDDGEIVATKEFNVAINTTRLELASMAYDASVQLFAEVASFCIESDGQMMRTGDKWTGHTNRQKEYTRLLEAHPELIVDHPEN